MTTDSIQPDTADVRAAGQVYIDPAAYADEERFHQACTLLRRHDPIHLVEHPEFPPFWAMTRHADVYEVELHPKEFHNAPVPVLAERQAIEQMELSGQMLRTLIHMDDPDHRTHRALAVD
jgi:hypothetical protein